MIRPKKSELFSNSIFHSLCPSSLSPTPSPASSKLWRRFTSSGKNLFLSVHSFSAFLPPADGGDVETAGGTETDESVHTVPTNPPAKVKMILEGLMGRGKVRVMDWGSPYGGAARW